MKSHVSMEQRVCIICANTYDTGSILLDTRLRESLDRNTVVGNGICPEHEKLEQEFIALVGVDPEKSTTENGAMTLAGAYRTGKIAHIKRAAWEKVFDGPCPDLPMVFVEEEVIARLEALTEGEPA